MGLHHQILRRSCLVVFAGSLLFSGCVSDYSFSGAAPGSSSEFSGTGISGGSGSEGTGSLGVPAVSGNYPSNTALIQAIKPTLAIRGINCLLCHGNIGSNIVTDFGHNSDSNGLLEMDDPTQHFFGPNRTAYDDAEDGNPLGGWQTGSVNGVVYVPSEQISASVSKTMFGVNSSATYSQVMSWTSGSNPMGASNPLPATPMSSILQPGLIQGLAAIHIGYPQQNQIVSLVSGASLSQAPSVAIVASSGQPQPSISGLAASSGNTFMRNGTAAAPGAVACTGDVVVIGPLFLKSATINTNDQGCRLYVTGTVIVQGALTVQGSANANLQISSAKAILFGFDLLHLGYAFGTNGSNVRSAGATSLPLPDSSSFIRFNMGDDDNYYPTNAPAGFASVQAFFDSVVQDAVLIDGGHLTSGKTGPSNWVGSELVDAYSTAQPSAPYVTADGGYRLAYDYSHVVLNAPQIHGRYGGAISGVMVGDVALFLLSCDDSSCSASSATGLGVNFAYDPIFDNVQQILPLFPNVFTASAP